MQRCSHLLLRLYRMAHVMEALAINRKMHRERLNPPEQDASLRGNAIADVAGSIEELRKGD